MAPCQSVQNLSPIWKTRFTIAFLEVRQTSPTVAAQAQPSVNHFVSTPWSMDHSIQLGVGTRLSHAGHLGTIRYIGGVDGTQGMWLGVEWDDPHRGKHDGVKGNKRYFSCM